MVFVEQLPIRIARHELLPPVSRVGRSPRPSLIGVTAGPFAPGGLGICRFERGNRNLRARARPDHSAVQGRGLPVAARGVPYRPEHQQPLRRNFQYDGGGGGGGVGGGGHQTLGWQYPASSNRQCFDLSYRTSPYLAHDLIRTTSQGRPSDQRQFGNKSQTEVTARRAQPEFLIPTPCPPQLINLPAVRRGMTRGAWSGGAQHAATPRRAWLPPRGSGSRRS